MIHANDNGRPINFISMFSGIEAASVAFGPLGWKAICFAEIEKFPSAVLAHHYPDVPNVGDMSKHDWSQYDGKVDIVCGGPPCQDFSIAGLRAGLDGARGNLSITYMRALHAIKPRNAVVENVPGWLNDKKNAFGCFLAGLVGADDPLRTPDGKSWPNAGMVAGPLGRAAWRVLDAQYFTLAQRRRRVIVVADFGNGADPAAVLFERKGLFGNSPPSRETGKNVAGTASQGFSASSLGTYRRADVSGAVRAAGGDLGGGSENLVAFAPEIARCVATREGSSQDYETTTMVAVAGTLCKDSFSGGMGGRTEGAAAGHVVAIASIHADSIGRAGEAVTPSADAAGVVRLRNPGMGVIDDGTTYNLMASGHPHAVCVTGDIAHTLKAEGADASEDGTGRGTPIVAQTVAIRGRDGGATAELGGEVATALRASQGGGDKPHVLIDGIPDTAGTMKACAQSGGFSNSADHAAAGYMVPVTTSAVRRLTARECERLQGFQFLCSPDYPGAWQDDAGRWWSPDYTAIPWRGKPAEECPDGPRYKALGNSWAVPKFAWLGRRIAAHMPTAANLNASPRFAA